VFLTGCDEFTGGVDTLAIITLLQARYIKIITYFEGIFIGSKNLQI